jgi:ABC-2 type transport system ATP-binding protein
MIEALSLRKSFGAKQALAGISFSVGEGEIYGLLGPNGAGKTTTTRILAGLLHPDSGSARVAGYDVVVEPERVRASIGILTEVPGLYERLRALEYLDFYGQIYGLDGPRRRARVEALMRLLGIWEVRSERLQSFSKGMKQKVAITRALIHEPRVLFFDEPTAALDPEAAKTVRDHLVQLIQDERRTVLLCSHNLAEVEQICARLSIVYGGRALTEASPAELKAAVARSVEVRLVRVDPAYVDVIRCVAGVNDVTAQDGTISYRTADAWHVNPVVVRQLVSVGADVVDVQLEPVTLEDAYLHFIRTASGGRELASVAAMGPAS